MKRISTAPALAFALALAAGTAEAQRLDFVNIGTAADEAAHEAAGWGPLEPATHGGNWGALGNDVGGADCDLAEGEDCDAATRVTWAGDCYDGAAVTPANNLCLAPAGTGPGADPATVAEPDSFALLGRAARVVLDPGAERAKTLRMRVLDGIGYDAFEVFVRNIALNELGEGVIPALAGGDTAVLVYRFDPYAPENLASKTVSEQWRVHEIDLHRYRFQLELKDYQLEVIVQVNAFPWASFGTFGQLGVDWIELVGD